MVQIFDKSYLFRSTIHRCVPHIGALAAAATTTDAYVLYSATWFQSFLISQFCTNAFHFLSRFYWNIERRVSLSPIRIPGKLRRLPNRWRCFYPGPSNSDISSIILDYDCDDGASPASTRVGRAMGWSSDRESSLRRAPSEASRRSQLLENLRIAFQIRSSRSLPSSKAFQ